MPTKAPNLKKHDSTGFYYELAFTDADKAWVGKVTDVQVNGKTCTSVSSVDEVSGKSETYFIDAGTGSIYTYWNSLANYPFDIVLSTENNGNLTLTVNRKGYSDPTVSIK